MGEPFQSGGDSFIGTRLIPSTNNLTERIIRAFCQHYKNMAGFESVETARFQLQLFRFFYRLTPQRETERKEDRGLCPLQRAGWDLRGIPVAEYVRSLTEALVDEPDEPEDPPSETPASTLPRARPRQKEAA